MTNQEDGAPRESWDHAHETRACTATDLLEVGPDTPLDVLGAIDAYLAVFAAPVRNSRGEQACIHCGDQLTGMMAGLFGSGGFVWGLVHGEGHCRGCGWPARAHHRMKDKNGEELITLNNYVLQYLPDTEAELAEQQAQS